MLNLIECKGSFPLNECERESDKIEAHLCISSVRWVLFRFGCTGSVNKFGAKFLRIGWRCCDCHFWFYPVYRVQSHYSLDKYNIPTRSSSRSRPLSQWEWTPNVIFYCILSSHPSLRLSRDLDSVMLVYEWCWELQIVLTHKSKLSMHTNTFTCLFPPKTETKEMEPASFYFKIYAFLAHWP